VNGWPDQPDDWAQVEWHDEPRGLVYQSYRHAERAAHWLNTNEGVHEVWKFRRHKREDGRWVLQRRWVGVSWGLLGPPESEGGRERWN
jgi:hypothetical protein